MLNAIFEFIKQDSLGRRVTIGAAILVFMAALILVLGCFFNAPMLGGGSCLAVGVLIGQLL